jgi:hypothetical protein
MLIRSLAHLTGPIREASAETERFTGEMSSSGPASGPGEQINAPGDDTPSFMRMGGISGVRVRVEAAANKVVKETQEARRTIEKASDDLTELFGNVSKHQRKILEDISQSSTGFYEGMTLLMRAMEVVENIKKSQKSGKGTFYLLEELDRVIFAINTFMGRSGRAIDKDTLFGLANRRDRNSGNDGRSTGGNP